MNDLNRDRFLSLRRIAKRIPYYFVLAAFPIGVIAAIQFMALEYMPVWNESELNMAKHRVVDFSIAGDGQFAVVESLNILDSNTKPVGMSVTLTDLVDNSQVTLDCGPKVMLGAVSPCGNWLALINPSGKISISAIEESLQGATVEVSSSDYIQDLVWSNDSKTLIAKAENSICLIDGRTGRLVSKLLIDSTSRLVLPPEENCCAVCSQGIYTLYDLDTGEKMRDVPIDPQSRQVAISSNLQFAACVVNDSMKMIDLANGNEIWSRPVQVPLSLKNAVAFTDVDQCVALITCENSQSSPTVNILDVLDQRLVCRCSVDSCEIAGAHFASDDSVWLWNADGLMSRYDWQSQRASGRQEVSLTQQDGLLPDFE